MLDRQQIGLRISVLRKKAGLSQAELAEKLGISPQAISKWESGKNLPDIDTFCELAWLFNTTLDSIVNSELLFEHSNEKFNLSDNIKKLAQNSQQRKLLESLAPYCSDSELEHIAKEIADQNLKLSLAADVGWQNSKTTALIPTGFFGESTLREIAPFFAKTIGRLMGNTDSGLRKMENILCCPECGERLTLQTDCEGESYFLCENGHRYDVTDGVIDFGSNEIYGETWSMFFRNYAGYKSFQKQQGNPRYQQGEIPYSEVRWRELEKLRPRVILDVACGTGGGMKYDLERINWPCLIIMADLSHRVLKYNKRYFSEELVNPYVDIVYLACDCSKMPIADCCIDAVVSNCGFESMSGKLLKGFQEAHRVIKKGGSCVYNMSILDDRGSANTQKWLRLIDPVDPLVKDEVFDIEEWQKICGDTGYPLTRIHKIYGEMPAPQGETFPFEREILQWMGMYLCVSQK